MSARKKNSLNHQVRRAYRQDALARICTMPEQEFGSAFEMQTVEVEHTWYKKYEVRAPRDYYHFRNNGARVLAVAHLDTVVAQKGRTPHFSLTQSGPLIVSGALDDRLGAYVILDLLPKLGVNCDWLLTTGEESCQSTAEFFHPEKEYDWVIEFDRAGTDVVMYQYEDEASRQAVQASGARVGNGSFSDIAVLEHLGAKAFNWGVGYEGNYHSEAGYAFLHNTFAMVAKYLRFHAQNAGSPMPHEPRRWEADAFWTDDAYHDSDTSRYQDEFLDCADCGALQAVDPATLICAYCDTCSGCSEESLTCTCPGGPGVWSVSPAGTATRLLSESESAKKALTDS